MSTVVEGVLVPVEWEDDGRVRTFALNTFDEREVRVECLRGVDSELRSLLGKKVRVTGRVHITEVIQIETFTVID